MKKLFAAMMALLLVVTMAFSTPALAEKKISPDDAAGNGSGT